LTDERGVLRLSAFACLGIGIVGAGAAALTGSEAILLDGCFNLTYFFMGLFTLKVLDWVARGDDERFPFGYSFFEPLVNGMKSLLVSGVSLMALFGAIDALLSGGRAIGLGWAVVYGAVASAACWTMAVITRRAQQRIASPLVHADAENWVVNAAVSSAVLAAFVGVALLERMGHTAVVPYVDPLLVAAVVLLSIAIPVRVAWHSMMGLLNRSAEPDVVETARSAVREGLAGLPVRDLAVRVIKPGRLHMIGAHVLLEAGGSPEMSALDAARGRVGDRLLSHDPNVIVDLIFTEDPRWFAELAPAR
jgi:predicted Co/Zn/Cd cation transporter (cation efflux family)